MLSAWRWAAAVNAGSMHVVAAPSCGDQAGRVPANCPVGACQVKQPTGTAPIGQAEQGRHATQRRDTEPLGAHARHTTPHLKEIESVNTWLVLHECCGPHFSYLRPDADGGRLSKPSIRAEFRQRGCRACEKRQQGQRRQHCDSSGAAIRRSCKLPAVVRPTCRQGPSGAAGRSARCSSLSPA